MSRLLIFDEGVKLVTQRINQLGNSTRPWADWRCDPTRPTYGDVEGNPDSSAGANQKTHPLASPRSQCLAIISPELSVLFLGHPLVVLRGSSVVLDIRLRFGKPTKSKFNPGPERDPVREGIGLAPP
jgi:hypothetical protein